MLAPTNSVSLPIRASFATVSEAIAAVHQNANSEESLMPFMIKPKNAPETVAKEWLDYGHSLGLSLDPICAEITDNPNPTDVKLIGEGFGFVLPLKSLLT